MRTAQQSSSTVWNKWSRSVKLVYAFYLFKVVHLHGIPLSLASHHGCSVVSTDISVQFINKTFHFCNTGWARSRVSFWCFGPHCPCIKWMILVLSHVCLYCMLIWCFHIWSNHTGEWCNNNPVYWFSKCLCSNMRFPQSLRNSFD